MIYKQKFTFAADSLALIFKTLVIVIGLTTTTHGANAAAIDTEPRAVTLNEPAGTSVHKYTDTRPATFARHPSNGKRTIKGHSLWLYEVSIALSQDYDNDGHYSTFSITLDFDTSLHTPWVYAVLYVSNDNGPWYEYAVTGNFQINSGDLSDAYTIHATLDSGYPTGLYNHYVEVYDAYSHDLLTSYGPQDNHYFYELPFESSAHDHSFGISSNVTLSFSGAGSLPPTSIALLAGLLAARRNSTRRRKRPQQQ